MVLRMATLASGGRIDLKTVQEEISRTRHTRPFAGEDIDFSGLLGGDYSRRFDPFELAQLKFVIEVCKNSNSLADAGKKLFAVSRKEKKSGNDSDRISKYLARFGLNFQCVREFPGNFS